jgi:glycerol-3-phosphate acyltransferase PlsY
MIAARVILALVFAYLVGGIPSGLLLSRWFYKADIRSMGSGNIGATNMYRSFGLGAGVATFLVDFAKGVVAVGAARWLFVPTGISPEVHDWAMVGATLAVLLGHSFSPYIGFQGGKGIATGSGAILVLTPLAYPICMVTWTIVTALTRRVSAGSVVVVIEYPLIILWLYGDSTPIVLFSFVGAALVLWQHRANVQRLLRGEEPALQWPPGKQAKAEHPEGGGSA